MLKLHDRSDIYPIACEIANGQLQGDITPFNKYILVLHKDVMKLTYMAQSI